MPGIILRSASLAVLRSSGSCPMSFAASLAAGLVSLLAGAGVGVGGGGRGAGAGGRPVEDRTDVLKDIEVPLDLEFDEEALPSIDLETGQPLHWSDEPDALRLNGAHELELEPVVREAIQLAEPIAPLCREDCPGLCAVCGADLSQGPHEHEEELDPRMEALRAFRVDAGDEVH